MTEPKHTPGNWIVDSAECLKIRNGLGSIAMIMQTNLVGRISSEETHANAHLIAAAPDMYEALKCVLAQISVLLDDPSRMDDMQSCAVARAALAKAEGKI